eukprot:TRINITY_DN28822_c0_g1_i4.p1 TRINITY_DN28822_c0_g1~~TRINITY_DN28822_c0_g1_i4.p1  ORF type:complete len:385 (-),score=54.88 TRINITY_DN28822_c0_g1_i4:43-1197(-)
MRRVIFLTWLLLQRSQAATTVQVARADKLRLAGEQLQRTQRNAEAEIVYRKAFAANPQDAAVLNNLGVLAKAREARAEAEALYSAAVSADPTMGAAHGNLGQLLAQTGATQKAVESFREAVRLGRSEFQAHLGLTLLAEEKASLSGGGVANHARRSEAEASIQAALDAATFSAAQQTTQLESALAWLHSNRLVHEVKRSAADAASQLLVRTENSMTEEADATCRAQQGTCNSPPRRLAHREGVSSKSKDGGARRRQHPPDLLAVTIATSTNQPGLEMLLHSAEAAGLAIWVRGADAATLRAWGTAAGGWGIKLRALADVAARAPSRDSIILWVDAYCSPSTNLKRSLGTLMRELAKTAPIPESQRKGQTDTSCSIKQSGCSSLF